MTQGYSKQNVNFWQKSIRITENGVVWSSYLLDTLSIIMYFKSPPEKSVNKTNQKLQKSQSSFHQLLSRGEGSLVKTKVDLKCCLHYLNYRTICSESSHICSLNCFPREITKWQRLRDQKAELEHINGKELHCWKNHGWYNLTSS